MSKDTAETPQPVESIEDFVSQAIDSQEEAEEHEIEVDETVEEQSSESEDESEPDEVAEVDENDDEPESELEEEVPEDEPAADSAEPVNTESVLEAPEHWAASDREIFNNQTEESKEWLLKRHREMEGNLTRKSQEFANNNRQLDAIKDALKPYEQQFNSAGLDHAGAVRQLASWDTALRTGGKDAILKLAQTYNIDMNTDESEYIDPEVASIRNELRQLKDASTRQIAEAQHQKQTELMGVIEAFETETDETGNLAHPHFAALQDDITRLFQAGIAKDLADGYTKALSFRPDLTPVKAVKSTVTKVDQATKVKNAKRAATGLKSSGAVGKRERSKMTLEEEIASQF